MKKITAILIAILIGCNVNCLAQGKVTRQKKETTETRQKPTKTKPANQQQNSAQSTPTKSNKPLTGTINGHEWVDLGLPSGLKWATCNIGATTPLGYGDYFAWGETKTKSEYTVGNSLTYDKSVSTLQSEGIINSTGNLNWNYDVARANWGSTWRMPTKAECDELVNNCTWTWTTQDGNNGYKVTGKNGKSIFLPAAGYRYGSSLDDAGEYGYYWSSSVCDDSSSAYYLRFYESDLRTDWINRYNGRSVRPVSE